FVVACRCEIDGGGQNPMSRKTRTGRSNLLQALQKQAASDEQEKTHSNLDDNETGPNPGLSMPANYTSHFRFESRRKTKPAAWQGRKQANHYPSGRAYPGG